MKQLVIDARMINDSGIGTYIKNIVPFLKNKFNITLLGNKKEILKNKDFNDIEIIKFEAKIYSFKEQILYPFVVPKCKVFWSPHINVPFFPIKALKIITTIHDLNHLSFDNNFNFYKKKYAKILYFNAAKKSDRIITVSEFSKSEIINILNIKESLISVIYGGVNELFFLDSNKKLNFELPKKYFLFVGNVKPHKNLITLLKAYSKLPSNITNEYKLVIIGKKEGFITPEFQVFNFINLNKLQDNILFSGYIEDEFLPSIYQKASIFIFPSLYEGFGLPILESMASKTVVLSSNLASLPEVGGNSIHYFNPNDELQLKNTIIEVLKNSDLEKELISKAYDRAKTFSWKQSAKKHLKVIDELFK